MTKRKLINPEKVTVYDGFVRNSRWSETPAGQRIDRFASDRFIPFDRPACYTDKKDKTVPRKSQPRLLKVTIKKWSLSNYTAVSFCSSGLRCSFHCCCCLRSMTRRGGKKSSSNSNTVSLLTVFWDITSAAAGSIQIYATRVFTQQFRRK